jgi:hypothetical protein
MHASDGQIEAIEHAFADAFAAWDLRLPVGAAFTREGGHIFQRGWHIGFVWGEENGEEYLEYLAQHRMTDDRHHRIWASGRIEQLPTASSMMVIPRGASEAEIKALETNFSARHAAISAQLRERGLLPPVGENLAALEINEFLRSGGEHDEN